MTEKVEERSALALDSLRNIAETLGFEGDKDSEKCLLELADEFSDALEAERKAREEDKQSWSAKMLHRAGAEIADLRAQLERAMAALEQVKTAHISKVSEIVDTTLSELKGSKTDDSA